MIEFNLPKIFFGVGSIEKIKELRGKRALIICGNTAKKYKIIDIVKELLNDEITIYDKVLSEPTTDELDECVAYAKQLKPEIIIGIGGGSVIDVGKCVAGLIANDGKAIDYLEIDGSKKIKNKGVPFIAIPTTAGTGSEVTSNGVFKNPLNNIKRSIRSELLTPFMAICEPKFTYTMSRELTAFTGIDALSHLIEGLLSSRANELTDSIAITGIKLIKENIFDAMDNDENAREKMFFASLLGGIIISTAGLCIPHGISPVLGGILNIPHSIANCILLTKCIEFNYEIAKNKGINLDEIKEFIKKINIKYKLPKIDNHIITHIAKFCYAKNNMKKITQENFYKIISEAIEEWQ